MLPPIDPPLSITGTIRLTNNIIAGGVLIDGCDSSGFVTPEELQNFANLIIETFDGSPEADQKYRDQIKYDNAHAAVATTEQTAIIVQAVLKVLVKEIAVAQPTYVVPPTQVLVTKVQTEIDSAKPPG
jgi:hypothetical protein